MQVEIPVPIADFYFPTEPRPMLAFVDGQVHHGKAQMIKDEETSSLLRTKGYRVLELYYESYMDKKKEQLYQQIIDNLRRNNEVSHA